MMFNSTSSGDLESNGCGEKLAKALLEMVVDKEQTVEVVNKAMETIWELANQSKVGNLLVRRETVGRETE